MTWKLCVSMLTLFGSSAIWADEPPKPAEPQGQQTPGAKDSAPAVKSDPGRVRPVDAELLRALEKQTTPADEEGHPLVRIGHRMRDVQGRLVKSDSGDETQDLQKGIVGDIDKLIDEIKKGAACPTCGAAQCSKHSKPNRKTNNPQGQQQGQPSKGTEPKEGDVAARPGQVSDEQAKANQRLVRAVWGHLPEKLREEMQQAFKESDLPKYRSLIEQYFQAIAEKNEPRR